MDLITSDDIKKSSKKRDKEATPATSGSAKKMKPNFLSQSCDYQEKYLDLLHEQIHALAGIQKELQIFRESYCAVNNIHVVTDTSNIDDLLDSQEED